MRSDSSNRQLRLGVVEAFGLVRASGAADVLQAGSAGSPEGPLSLAGAVGPGALYALESLILFGFASVAVEVRPGGMPAQGWTGLGLGGWAGLCGRPQLHGY